MLINACLAELCGTAVAFICARATEVPHAHRASTGRPRVAAAEATRLAFSEFERIRRAIAAEAPHIAARGATDEDGSTPTWKDAAILQGERARRERGPGNGASLQVEPVLR